MHTVNVKPEISPYKQPKKSKKPPDNEIFKSNYSIQCSSGGERDNLIQKLKVIEISSSQCYNGSIRKYKHWSYCNNSMMQFSIYLPNRNNFNERLPALFYLAGLTANEDSFMEKALALRKASELKLVLVCPDTCPRDTEVEEYEESPVLGTGASYYLNATTEKWRPNYQMMTYVSEELPDLITLNFPVNSEQFSISGHSVGGHAALYLSLQEYSRFKSCSAFAPVCSLIHNELGSQALQAYLGEDKEEWEDFDTLSVLKASGGKLKVPTLIDQGEDDEFYINGVDHLNFKLFKKSIAKNETKFIFNIHEGYDHTYWFIQVFVDKHLEFHYNILTEKYRKKLSLKDTKVSLISLVYFTVLIAILAFVMSFYYSY